MTRERLDSEDDLDDIIQRDSAQDKMKLQNLLSKFMQFRDMFPKPAKPVHVYLII